jgi:hypothetical protein
VGDDEAPPPEKDPGNGRFLPGNNGGKGRPKGSRNRLGEAFIADMHEAWITAGPDVINRVIKEDPATFLRSVVAILPKEVDVNVNKYDSMTDDQLRTQFLAALRDAQSLGLDIGVGEPANPDQAAPGKPPSAVPPLH